jgi:hypothetical protein
MRKESRLEELSLRYLDAAYNLARWLVIRNQDAADSRPLCPRLRLGGIAACPT